ncbi:RNase H domain-containing protein [Trichonephila clavipes]|nr:RNase H domain-containing protein [Trichonephila clavipes]
MWKHGLIDLNVDTSTPFSCITPIDSFNLVKFREELLRKMALEVINDIPDQALIIYTDGSCSDAGRTGSGIFSNTPGNDVKISIRNSDHCSVFRSELIANSGALDYGLNSNKDSIWILTDSRSSIQYLKNWPKIVNSTGLNILSKLTRLDQRKQVCLQWIPSHVGVPGNEAAYELAGRGCDISNPSFTVLDHSEIPSLQGIKMNLTWRNPPAHQWYDAKSPGVSIQCRRSRAHQMALASFRSGHLRSMTFVQRVKSFFTCPCSLPASPAHILDCWGISLRQLFEDQDLVCEIIRRKDQRTWCRLSCAKGSGNNNDNSIIVLKLVLYMPGGRHLGFFLAKSHFSPNAVFIVRHFRPNV